VFHDSATGARDYRGRLIDFVTAALKAARLELRGARRRHRHCTTTVAVKRCLLDFAGA
jgi:hypothetical protein